ncbi:putative Ig domain-containing protein [Subtercola sp. YIM 133946]|uniref:putative Ig domain-containing protein n=1 Tax=Subtercola sp. YIM 133946 TaxID=3118909 RepID=UPI002F92E35E
MSAEKNQRRPFLVACGGGVLAAALVVAPVVSYASFADEGGGATRSDVSSPASDDSTSPSSASPSSDGASDPGSDASSSLSPLSASSSSSSDGGSDPASASPGPAASDASGGTRADSGASDPTSSDATPAESATSGGAAENAADSSQASGVATAVVSPEAIVTEPAPDAAPVITSGRMPDGVVGHVYSYTLTADQPVAFTVSGLPAGLTFDPQTATVSGTPTTAGDSELFVTATNAAGSATEIGLFMTINAVLGDAGPTITSSSLPHGVSGTPYTFRFTADRPVIWTLTGLPQGLTFNRAEGTIAGTPEGDGQFPLTVTATAADGTSTAEIDTLVIDAVISSGPTITSGAPTHGVIGVGYSFRFTADRTVLWTTSGVPAGLTFDRVSGILSGTPTVVGDFPIILKATAADGSSTTVVVTFTVDPVITSPGTPPVFVGTPVPPATVGAPFSFTPEVRSSSPVSIDFTGSVPGLTYDPATHTLTGVPTAKGDYPITFTAHNDSSEPAVSTLTLTVNPAVVVPPTNPPTDPPTPPTTPPVVPPTDPPVVAPTGPDGSSDASGSGTGAGAASADSSSSYSDDARHQADSGAASSSTAVTGSDASTLAETGASSDLAAARGVTAALLLLGGASLLAFLRRHRHHRSDR